MKNYPVYTSAVTLGTSLSDAAVGDVVVGFLAFANTSVSDVAVTVKDAAGKVYLPAVSMPAGQLTIIPIADGGLFFRGGVQWAAATGAVVDAWIRLEVRP